MTFLGGRGFGGDADAGRDHQTARIIVGNEPNGDTQGVCDVLDTGDGDGVRTALGQASDGEVWIRSGVYDLSLSTDSSVLVVSDDVTIRGAGRFASIILGRADQRQVLSAGARVTLQDFGVTMPLPDPGATGDRVIEAGGNHIADRVRLTLSASYTDTDLVNESLRRGFSMLGAGRVTAVDVINGPRRLDEDPSNEPFIGITDEDAGPQFVAAQWDRLFVNGSDIGVRVRRFVSVNQVRALQCSRFAIDLLNALTASVRTGQLRTLPATGVSAAAVRIMSTTSGAKRGALIGGLHIQGSGDDGVRIAATAGSHERHIISDCFIEGFTNGVLIPASADRVNVVNNQIIGAATPVNNSGTNTIQANNNT